MPWHFGVRTNLRLLRVFMFGTLLVSAIVSASSRRQLAGIHDSRETHLANVRQLTFGGQNAEAYFSGDGKRLTFQSVRDGYECD
ncbi:hypothetical protein ACTGVF_11385, partial [Streptococcus suis]